MKRVSTSWRQKMNSQIRNSAREYLFLIGNTLSRKNIPLDIIDRGLHHMRNERISVLKQLLMDLRKHDGPIGIDPTNGTIISHRKPKPKEEIQWIRD